ncbi:hypothetical protein LWI29_029129 [Acer saccharum]|uniref:Uncharacterized protein n=1 Tax=Acer saccharum TaxID=4024 RepID=A0AA39W0R2_ACESA|nr:hypothetical protein LWI29_029129 [Acer saccharum]
MEVGPKQIKQVTKCIKDIYEITSNKLKVKALATKKKKTQVKVVVAQLVISLSQLVKKKEKNAATFVCFNTFFSISLHAFLSLNPHLTAFNKWR